MSQLGQKLDQLQLLTLDQPLCVSVDILDVAPAFPTARQYFHLLWKVSKSNEHRDMDATGSRCTHGKAEGETSAALSVPEKAYEEEAQAGGPRK